MTCKEKTIEELRCDNHIKSKMISLLDEAEACEYIVEMYAGRNYTPHIESAIRWLICALIDKRQECAALQFNTVLYRPVLDMPEQQRVAYKKDARRVLRAGPIGVSHANLSTL